MKTWKQWLHAQGLYCQHENGDILHMTTCRSQAVMNFWTNSLTVPNDLMDQKDTDPDLHHFIIEGFTSWWQHLSPMISPPQTSCIPTPTHLGWYTLLTVLLHPSLATLQQQHYSNRARKMTCASWASQFIQQTGHHLYKLWLFHNQALHQQTIVNHHGIDNLEYSITVEFHMGPISLPSHFNGYFSKPLATLLTKDAVSKKNGLSWYNKQEKFQNLTIRDAFQTNVILHHWVHLSTTTRCRSKVNTNYMFYVTNRISSGLNCEFLPTGLLLCHSPHVLNKKLWGRMVGDVEALLRCCLAIIS